MPRAELPPILLSEVREAGLTLWISCNAYRCSNSVELPASEIPLPGHFDMNDVGHSFRCTKCGRRRGNNAYPHHRGWVQYLRRTGQRDRLPWFAAMMSDDD